ncbi:LysE family transporter [Streptomyces sp. NPDC001307]|uniref:LysE family transporter n=1 Tax=Streptomyces sp. NPDC001307 TaxID=3364560 RepID=UPI0036B4C69C
MAGAADALRTVAGIATGLLLWGALTVAGRAAALAAAPAAYLVVRLLGAGYLMLLGVRALRRSHHAPSAVPGTGAPHGAGSPWRTGLISNVLNRRSPCATPGCPRPWPRRTCPPPGP